MLITFFFGFRFFGLTILLAIIRRLLKAPKWSAPLSFGAGKVGFGAFLIVIFMFIYMFGALRGGVSFSRSYTGQEVFDELNRHRLSVGSTQVIINEYLCDNLVNRWRVARGRLTVDVRTYYIKAKDSEKILLAHLLINNQEKSYSLNCSTSRLQ